MANETMKNGKMPISAKQEMDELSAYRDGLVLEGSVLDVDPALKKWLDDKGFTCRWLNGSKYTKAGGFSANGWRALRIKDVPEQIRSAGSFSFGESPEGYLVRNDLVLGIRTAEVNAAHKARLQERADRISGKDTLKKQASRLRETLGDKAVIDDKYDE